MGTGPAAAAAAAAAAADAAAWATNDLEQRHPERNRLVRRAKHGSDLLLSVQAEARPPREGEDGTQRCYLKQGQQDEEARDLREGDAHAVVNGLQQESDCVPCWDPVRCQRAGRRLLGAALSASAIALRWAAGGGLTSQNVV